MWQCHQTICLSIVVWPGETSKLIHLVDRSVVYYHCNPKTPDSSCSSLLFYCTMSLATELRIGASARKDVSADYFGANHFGADHFGAHGR